MSLNPVRSVAFRGMLRSLFKYRLAPLRGSIDAVSNGRCQGWAFGVKSASPIEVELFVDGRLAGRGLADRHRDDLERGGIGTGRHGFVIEMSDAMRDGGYHRVEARSRDGRLIAMREAVQIVPKLTPMEFARRAPWVDGEDAAFERALARLRQDDALGAGAEAQVRFFREHGWLKLEQAVSHMFIDKVLADVEQAWQDLPPQLVLNNTLSKPTPMAEMAKAEGFRNTSVRYLDFHNVSEAAAEIMMLPAVLRFAELCFGEKVAAMQTLLFENGTQQASHQDFAFVHSLRPACLLGAWVALEDARADAGPLFYWDRSHRFAKYVFDDGSVLAEGDGAHVRAFEQYLETTCRERGLERLVFTPRKGDLLIWHSALVHGGMPRNDPALTRRSMVSHYTTQAAYPRDQRNLNRTPRAIERNGGIYCAARGRGHIENRYRFDPRPQSSQQRS